MKFIVMDMGTGLPLTAADSLAAALASMTEIARGDIEGVLREAGAVTSIRRLSVLPEVVLLDAISRARSEAQTKAELRKIEERVDAILNPAT